MAVIRTEGCPTTVVDALAEDGEWITPKCYFVKFQPLRWVELCMFKCPRCGYFDVCRLDSCACGR